MEINFELVKWDEPMPPFIKSFVLFPKNKKKRSTLFWDESVTFISIDVDD